jgi:uncharacterized cupin superfamily protein
VSDASRDQMRVVNSNQLEWDSQSSPTGKFARAGRKLSEALGRNRWWSDLNQRHPFDVEITRIPAGAASCPYHSHSAQWEFFHVISGRGTLRHSEGTRAIEAGDAFIFKPNEPHQLINDSADDLVLYVVADNPLGETCHYPDSNKWAVKAPRYQLIRSEALDYYDGEE